MRSDLVVVRSAETVDGAVVLQVRTASGALEDAVLDPQELEAILARSADRRPVGLPEDHEAQFLLVESARIRLARQEPGELTRLPLPTSAIQRA